MNDESHTTPVLLTDPPNIKKFQKKGIKTCHTFGSLSLLRHSSLSCCNLMRTFSNHSPCGGHGGVTNKVTIPCDAEPSEVVVMNDPFWPPFASWELCQCFVPCHHLGTIHCTKITTLINGSCLAHPAPGKHLLRLDPSRPCGSGGFETHELHCMLKQCATPRFHSCKGSLAARAVSQQ